MKRFFKRLLAAWITGAVWFGGGVCVICAAGAIVERQRPTAREEWTQAQIDQLREEMSAMARAAMYDEIAANPIDEEGGL